jgi:Spy/CpxP family protein refolding chaperone
MRGITMQRQRLLTLALVAAGLMAYNTPATAQTGDQPPVRTSADSGRRMLDPVGRILEQRSELKITDEQATRLEAIRAKYLERNRGQMEERASMDSTRTEVMAVLTPEQQKQVGEMRKQWRSQHGGRHSHKHGGDDDD